MGNNSDIYRIREEIMNIKVTPSVILRYLLMIISFLVIADVAGAILKLTFNEHSLNNLFRLFDLDIEVSIPTFYQAVTLLISSMLLLYIARIRRNVKNEYLYWLWLALVFLYLSLDEAALIHEMLMGVFRRTFQLSGLFYYGWVVPYGMVMIIGTTLYLRFLMRLPRRTLFLFILSGAVYITGAMVIEMFQGSQESGSGLSELSSAVYPLFEETLEMLGIALFIYSLLDYISSTANSLTIRVYKKDHPPAN
jgi:hypothetical protein